MKQRLIIFGFIFLAFCSGSVLGFIVNSHMVQEEWKSIRSNPDYQSDRIFKHMTSKLALTQQQQSSIKPIVKEHFRITDQIREKSIPELQNEMDRYQAAVAKNLTKEQTKIWNETCQWVRENCYGFKD